jgi:hypothetical protein
VLSRRSHKAAGTARPGNRATIFPFPAIDQESATQEDPRGALKLRFLSKDLSRTARSGEHSQRQRHSTHDECTKESSFQASSDSLSDPSKPLFAKQMTNTVQPDVGLRKAALK